MKKNLFIVWGIVQWSLGLLIISGLRVEPPPFTWGRWFFLPAFYLVEALIGSMMVFAGIRTIQTKAFWQMPMLKLRKRN